MLQVRSMRNLTCLRTLGRIFETLFLLSNEIHYMKVQNKPKHSLQNMQNIAKACSRSKSYLMMKKQLLSTFIKRIKHSGLQKSTFETRKKNQL